jgi:hypothetical protein
MHLNLFVFVKSTEEPDRRFADAGELAAALGDVAA